MWKLIVGFIAFAALALFVLMKSGGDIDMSGEKHGVESHAPETPAAAPAPAAAPSPEPAQAASAAAVPDAAASDVRPPAEAQTK